MGSLQGLAGGAGLERALRASGGNMMEGHGLGFAATQIHVGGMISKCTESTAGENE
ncbi:hypothetical protein P7K49_000108, partial [Saguinus oedipus]